MNSPSMSIDDLYSKLKRSFEKYEERQNKRARVMVPEAVLSSDSSSNNDTVDAAATHTELSPFDGISKLRESISKNNLAEPEELISSSELQRRQRVEDELRRKCDMLKKKNDTQAFKLLKWGKPSF